MPADRFAVYMLGIGGTGVVTVNQILGTAARLDGRYVCGLDQTGLSQKGGPVVSHLKICREPQEVANQISAGGTDLYLGFDLLVATQPRNLARAEPRRTIAVVSTSQIPTGRMVADTGLYFPELATTLDAINRVTRAGENFYLDAQAIAEGLFDDHMGANLVTLGAAYQLGALPVSAASIERAIELNGVAVDVNLLAFRWGRVAVVDSKQVEAAVSSAAQSAISSQAQQVVDSAGATGELRRLLEIRVPELMEYQGADYARRYVSFVARVAQIEHANVPGRTEVAEAVARYLFKLMAYKDEYEVARLHLDPAATDEVTARFGRGARVYWHLHPPLLRALGFKRKIKLGRWFMPGFRLLRAIRRLRGTPFDAFGYSRLRRMERALIGEYRSMLEAALAKLTPENHATIVALASLPDEIRGYEEIKLASVERYRAAALRLMAALM